MISILVRLVKEFVAQNRFVVFMAIGLSILHHTIQTVITPKLLARVFTNLDDPTATHQNIGLFLLAFSGDKLSEMTGSIFNVRIEPLLTSFIMSKFVNAMLVQYRATHKPVEVAFVIDKMYQVKSGLENLILYTFTQFLPLTISMLIAIVSVFFVNIKLGLIVLLAIIAIVGILAFLPKAPSSMRYRENLTMFMEDIFFNIEFVTACPYGMEHIKRHMKRHIDELRTSRLRSVGATSRNQIVAYMFATATYIGTIFYLLHLFNKGEVATKDFESNILTIGRLFELAYTLAYSWPDFSRDLVNLRAMKPFLEEIFAYETKEGAGPELVQNGSIDYNKVCFSYGEDRVLRELTIKIDSGTMVALVGRSGSGKSTFIKLMMDNVKPDSGEVCIGGAPIPALSSVAISHVISHMAQNTSSLLKLTVYQNIVFGVTTGEHDEALRIEVEELVVRYGLLSIFQDDKHFLDRVVEKNGDSLSGGQKQIIFLLHAYMNKDARILVVDEPTSALDKETRGLVMRILHDLKAAGKTLLVITHDDEVKIACDKVLHFQSGENPSWEREKVE